MISYKNNSGFVENVPLEKIAKEVGTPCYVYSKKEISDRCDELTSAFSIHPTLICYAVKANSNLSILKMIFAKGLGADIVSGGELERVLAAGAKPEKIVYSGVGKSPAEVRRAIEVGVASINVESLGEIETIQAQAKLLNKKTNVAIRINPNIDVKTNPYIATGLYSTKFGIAETELQAVVELIQKSSHVSLTGLTCHLGSQIMELRPFQEAADRILYLANALTKQDFKIDHIDLGGGLGIRYEEESPPTFKDYAKILTTPLAGSKYKLRIEPGRSIVGAAGTLLTQVMNIKKNPTKNFVIIDAAMTELIRPSLYEAYHSIVQVQKAEGESIQADVVGPVCETGDILGLDRKFAGIRTGDLLAIECAGAYGSSMASNYNTRPTAPEVLVDGDKFSIIRKRQSLNDLWALET